MEQLKAKKVFLTPEEIDKCREDMMQFASKEEEKETELERLSEEYKAKKKSLESEIVASKSHMRENLALINQKFKYVDVPFKIFTDNAIRKEYHIQTDMIELLEVRDLAPFAEPELEFSTYCVNIIDTPEKADEVFESDIELFSTESLILVVPDLLIKLFIFGSNDDYRVLRFMNNEVLSYWNNLPNEQNN